MTDIHSDETLLWLAETKFHPPLLRKDVVPRRHLLEDLHALLASHPFTLLSAPAGYGKSTLLASLLSTYPDLPMAWLSLDEEDNDPVRFLTALIVALQHLKLSCGTVAQSLLTDQAYPGSEVRRVMSVLINDVLETIPGNFTLILDDLHHITEPAIFAALDYLLEHIPQQMHLIVSTRVDPPLPLARLRARGELAELRMANMRFSDEEAITFFNDFMNLKLSDDELALLQSRMEGWPVGLRLLASSLDPIITPEERGIFIDYLMRTDRNIFDFLAEEVFNRQEQEVRTFLLETAILPELTATLCQAVTGREDSEVMLEKLYHRNLFLIQISPLYRQASLEYPDTRFDKPQFLTKDLNSDRRYRYHDLFAEFLRQRLILELQDRLPDLHLRAAQAQSDRSRAVVHYLAAAEWQKAVEIIEQIGAEMFIRGYFDTLSRWINILPANVRESHPLLLHYLSNCAFWKGSWEEVRSLLERALRGFEAAADETGQGEVLVNLATCAVARGDIEQGGVLYGQALAHIIPPHIRVQALLGRALANGTSGDWSQSEQDFMDAMALVHPNRDLDPLHLVALPYFHPEFAIVPGGLEQLERFARQARIQVGDEISLSRLMVDELTTTLHLFRGKLAEAIRTGERALALRKRLGGHPYLSLNASLFLMIAYAAKGDYAAIEPLFDDLFLGVDQTGQPPPDLIIYLFFAGRVRWLQGRLNEAREIYDQMSNLMKKEPHPDYPEARICIAWMESLLAMSEGRYREAESALCQPEVLGQKDRSSTMNGNTRLMLARLYWQQNRMREALNELAPALVYHEQLGIPFAILLEGQSVVPLLHHAIQQGIHERYAISLLELLGVKDEPRSVYVPYTEATLTPREVEVLRQIVLGFSNRTIAERLVITESTVKTHIYHIFAKLDVNTRAEAAVRTRELRLL